MMVLLLILSVVLAIMAPSITRKITREKAAPVETVDEPAVVEEDTSLPHDSRNPWHWVDKDITDAYYQGDNSDQAQNNTSRAIIGLSAAKDTDSSKLVINTPQNSYYPYFYYPHILFKNNNTSLGTLYLNNTSVAINNIGTTNIYKWQDQFRTKIDNVTRIGAKNVAIGTEALSKYQDTSKRINSSGISFLPAGIML